MEEYGIYHQAFNSILIVTLGYSEQMHSLSQLFSAKIQDIWKDYNMKNNLRRGEISIKSHKHLIIL